MADEVSQDPDDYTLTYRTLEKLCVDQETIDIVKHQVGNWQLLLSGDNIERNTIQFMPARFLEPDMERRSAQMAFFERECETEDPEDAIRRLESHSTMLYRMVEYRGLENEILKMRCNAGDHELKAVIESRDEESRLMYGTGSDFRRKANALRRKRTSRPEQD